MTLSNSTITSRIAKVNMGKGKALNALSKSETVGRRVNQTDTCIWDSGTLVTHIWGTFDLVVFNVVWCPSVHLPQNGLQLENSWL